MDPTVIPAPVRHRKPIAIAGIVLVILASLSVFLITNLNRARETANRSRCNKQMRALGQAIFLYANENRGALPPTLKELIVTQDITPEIFICPSSNHTRSPGDSLQQIADNLSAGGHLSYIYCGNAKTILWDPKTVLIYEPIANHGNGFHALFADGHNEFLTGPTAQKIQAELQSGQNPPPSHR